MMDKTLEELLKVEETSVTYATPDTNTQDDLFYLDVSGGGVVIESILVCLVDTTQDIKYDFQAKLDGSNWEDIENEAVTVTSQTSDELVRGNPKIINGHFGNARRVLTGTNAVAQDGKIVKMIFYWRRTEPGAELSINPA